MYSVSVNRNAHPTNIILTCPMNLHLCLRDRNSTWGMTAAPGCRLPRTPRGQIMSSKEAMVQDPEPPEVSSRASRVASVDWRWGWRRWWRRWKQLPRT